MPPQRLPAIEWRSWCRSVQIAAGANASNYGLGSWMASLWIECPPSAPFHLLLLLSWTEPGHKRKASKYCTSKGHFSEQKHHSAAPVPTKSSGKALHCWTTFHFTKVCCTSRHGLPGTVYITILPVVLASPGNAANEDWSSLLSTWITRINIWSSSFWPFFMSKFNYPNFPSITIILFDYHKGFLHQHFFTFSCSPS